jgi:integrase
MERRLASNQRMDLPCPNKIGAHRAVNPQETLKKAHAKALTESKVRRFVLHDLRHTSLTRLACACRDPWTVARIAGHGGIKIGEQYVHSIRMEHSPRWAEWLAYTKAGQNPKPPKRRKTGGPAPDAGQGTKLDTTENRTSEVVLQ